MPEQLPDQVPIETKVAVWNEYIGSREGRQKLACSFIHPLTSVASILERGGNQHGTLASAERTLRNSVRLLGRMALEGEDPPASFLANMRQLQHAIDTLGRPSAWDRLVLDEDDPVME